MHLSLTPFGIIFVSNTKWRKVTRQAKIIPLILNFYLTEWLQTMFLTRFWRTHAFRRKLKRSTSKSSTITFPRLYTIALKPHSQRIATLLRLLKRNAISSTLSQSSSRVCKSTLLSSLSGWTMQKEEQLARVKVERKEAKMVVKAREAKTRKMQILVQERIYLLQKSPVRKKQRSIDWSSLWSTARWWSATSWLTSTRQWTMCEDGACSWLRILSTRRRLRNAWRPTCRFQPRASSTSSSGVASAKHWKKNWQLKLLVTRRSLLSISSSWLSAKKSKKSMESTTRRPTLSSLFSTTRLTSTRRILRVWDSILKTLVWIRVVVAIIDLL